MLDAVTDANARLAELGVEKIVCIVYSNGAARLMKANGEEVYSHTDWKNPEVAVVLVLAWFEDRLQRLLTAHGHRC